MNVTNYDVHHILIDNGSLANVLFYDAFLNMGLSNDMLEKLNSPLVSFSRTTVPMEGDIRLSLVEGWAPT